MSDGHPEWLRAHADILDQHGYDHLDDGPGLGAIPDQMRMAADEIERLRARAELTVTLEADTTEFDAALERADAVVTGNVEGTMFPGVYKAALEALPETVAVPDLVLGAVYRLRNDGRRFVWRGFQSAGRGITRRTLPRVRWLDPSPGGSDVPISRDLLDDDVIEVLERDRHAY